MSNKTFISTGETPPASQIGATLEALAGTIAARREAGEESYTHRLLTASPDDVLKKLMEESGEVALAAKDVESWATSSLAAALAFEDGCGNDVELEELAVELPPEYSEAVDHLRYEAADVVYHLLVVLERYGVGLDEFAAELNNRMTDEERPQGAVRLHENQVNRGK
ncbi:phosphoribosyl-ATP pyrophosphatase [Eggerthella sinensis]|uniref:phosphoribosyl-ATP pyrophosphatase n=1 Tax=Eggerthella sinensis TaxID=242230 RepID=UPI001D093EA9|nr:phosphoribosyl-ATP diphosphatase [Eggerthella sinensis]MCB7039031.1 phosphoribosyl-ATP diphosphatase [Eggerthella sinensis]